MSSRMNSAGSTCRVYEVVIPSPRWLSGGDFMPEAYASGSIPGICPVGRTSYSRSIGRPSSCTAASGTRTGVQCSDGHRPERSSGGRRSPRTWNTLALLKDLGWRVLTVWECALKGPGRVSLDYLLVQCEDFVLHNATELEEIRGRLRLEGEGERFPQLRQLSQGAVHRDRRGAVRA